MVFAKEPPRTEIRTTAFMNTTLLLKAGSSDTAVDSAIEFQQDSRIWGLFPHSHLRGKSWEYRVVYPDGRKETVLSVPAYDFDWQTYYMFAKPLVVPKGTRLEATAHYDNSANNKFNPDASMDVRWGEQTWDEMLIGYFNYAVPRGSETEQQIIAARAAEQVEQQVRQVMRLFDRNKNGTIEQNEITALQKPVFDRIDADGDGVVTEDEVKAKLPELRALFKR